MNSSYSSPHFFNVDKFRVQSLKNSINENYVKSKNLIESKTKEIKKLQNSVIAYQKSFSELNRKILKNDNLSVENSTVLRKYKELEKQFFNLNKDYLEIQDDLREKNKLISDYQKLTENGKIKFKLLDDQNNELKRIIHSYEKNNKDLKELNNLKEEKIKELEKKNLEIKNELLLIQKNNKQNNINNEKLNENFQKEKLNLKNEIISLKKQIKILSQQIKENEKKHLLEIKAKEEIIKNLNEKLNKENNEQTLKITDLNNRIKNINNDREKLLKELKEITEENSQKNIIIKKLNNCILEYNQVIIQSKNELTDRDKSYENIEKEKDKLILKLTEVTNEKSKLEEKHKIFIEENRIQNTVYEEKISEIIKENSNKCDEINKLNEIIKTLKEDNKEIKSIPLDLEKSNIYLLNIRERQNELNQKISSLNDIIYEKEAIIETLKDKYNQKVSYYKLKISENKNRINNLMNNLIELKYYVNELERLLENKHINNTFSGKKVRRNSSMERIDKYKYNSIDFYNGSCVDNEKYNSQLIDSLKSMIMKIDNKLNESYRNEDEILKNCK